MPYADISSKATLQKFLGQEPTKWFKDRGFTFNHHAIGFSIQHYKTLKSEVFDYSFNHEAIKMVMDQLANPNNSPKLEADAHNLPKLVTENLKGGGTITYQKVK